MRKDISAIALAFALIGCGGSAEMNAMNATLNEAGVPADRTEISAAAAANITEVANATAPMPEVEADVTSAGFPFKTGVYITSGKCTPDNYARYEFAKTYRHEWEADQQQDFVKIVRLAPGRYRINEKIEADEKVDGWKGTVIYTASGPDGFTTDEPVVDYNDKGEAVPRKGQFMRYKWCSNASLGETG